MAAALEAIGLLGGTFDPVHNGHISIVHSYFNSGLLDKLFLILTPEPPHKQSQTLTGFGHRKEMLELAFGSIENIFISTIEEKLPKPSYTIRTIDYFRSEYPNTKLYLCIGEDSLHNFKDWYQWKSILTRCTLLVAKRPNAGAKPVPDDLESHVKFVRHSEIDISSSEIREKLTAGEKVKDMLPEKVFSYINKHHIYQN